MDDLKLIALDEDDLNVVSAHLQDAVMRVADIAYLPQERRFAAILNRFDWGAAETAEDSSGKPAYIRRRTAFRLERVTGARTQELDLADKKRVLNLLAVRFEPVAEGDPAGHVTLFFAAGAAIRLDVECIEAEMRDLGGAWTTKSKPVHADDDRPDG